MSEANGLRIKVSGYQMRAAEAVRQLIDGLIDIAWVDEVGPDYTLVRTDVGLELTNPKNYEWVTGLIDSELSRHWIYAKFEPITIPRDDDPD
jgi:hypothetical protein